jgi:hypothetical protein
VKGYPVAVPSLERALSALLDEEVLTDVRWLWLGCQTAPGLRGLRAGPEACTACGWLIRSRGGRCPSGPGTRRASKSRREALYGRNGPTPLRTGAAYLQLSPRSGEIAGGKQQVRP